MRGYRLAALLVSLSSTACGMSQLAQRSILDCQGGSFDACSEAAAHARRGREGVSEDHAASCAYQRRAYTLALAACDAGDAGACRRARTAANVLHSGHALGECGPDAPEATEEEIARMELRLCEASETDTCVYVAERMAKDPAKAKDAYALLVERCESSGSGFVCGNRISWIENGTGTAKDPALAAAMRLAWCEGAELRPGTLCHPSWNPVAPGYVAALRAKAAGAGRYDRKGVALEPPAAKVAAAPPVSAPAPAPVAAPAPAPVAAPPPPKPAGPPPAPTCTPELVLPACAGADGKACVDEVKQRAFGFAHATVAYCSLTAACGRDLAGACVELGSRSRPGGNLIGLRAHLARLLVERCAAKKAEACRAAVATASYGDPRRPAEPEAQRFLVEACRLGHAASCDDLASLLNAERLSGTYEAAVAKLLEPSCAKRKRDAATCELVAVRAGVERKAAECEKGKAASCAFAAAALVDGSVDPKAKRPPAVAPGVDDADAGPRVATDVPRAAQLGARGCKLGSCEACAALARTGQAIPAEVVVPGRKACAKACPAKPKDGHGCLAAGTFLAAAVPVAELGTALEAYERAVVAKTAAGCVHFERLLREPELDRATEERMLSVATSHCRPKDSMYPYAAPEQRVRFQWAAARCKRGEHRSCVDAARSASARREELYAAAVAAGSRTVAMDRVNGLIAHDAPLFREAYGACDGTDGFSCESLAVHRADTLRVHGLPPTADFYSSARNGHEHACKGGDGAACLALTRWFDGVDEKRGPANPARVRELLQAGCDAPRPAAEACNRLGASFVREDLPRAAKLYVRGCRLGSEGACGRLRWLVEDGKLDAALRAEAEPLAKDACERQVKGACVGQPD